MTMINESAFPIPNDDRPGSYEAQPGMALRDYFAAKAMQGLLANDSDPLFERVAEWAYDIADEMLKERNKT
jgi:hypothetical protein